MTDQSDTPAEFVMGKGFTLDAAALRAYAWASGDYNPIHYDVERAKAMGLPGVIVHGLFSLGLLNRAVGEWARQQNPALKVLSMETRFVSVVQPGEKLSVIARPAVADKRATDANPQAEKIQSTVQVFLIKNGQREEVACSATFVLGP